MQISQQEMSAVDVKPKTHQGNWYTTDPYDAPVFGIFGSVFTKYVIKYVCLKFKPCNNI